MITIVIIIIIIIIIVTDDSLLFVGLYTQISPPSYCIYTGITAIHWLR